MRVLIFMLLASSLSAQCNVHTFWEQANDSVDIILNGTIIQCDQRLRYIIDFKMFDEPDRFRVITSSNTFETTEYIGSDEDIFTLTGFLRYRYYRNGSYSIDFLNDFVNDYSLVKSHIEGSGRILIDATPEDSVILRVYFSEFAASRVDLRAICQFETRVIRVDTIYACRAPKAAREHVLTINCDTIYVDTIDATQFAHTDTLEVFSNAQQAGYFVTDWYENEFGCQVPLRVKHIRHSDEVNVYIPNIVTDVFEPSVYADRIRVYSRSGALVHDSRSPWYIDQHVESAVYVYHIEAFGRDFFGDVTVLK